MLPSDAHPFGVAHRACVQFSAVFGTPSAGVCVAPGRVNLIGEHTDYNEGFVLPAAIDRGVAVAYAPRADGRLRAWSSAFNELREAPNRGQSPFFPEMGKTVTVPVSGWFAYVAGVASALAEAGHGVRGVDLAIHSDLPIGSGLSSSAALEVAVARALSEASGIAWDAAAMARLCQRAENVFVGVACGIMDQFAAALSQRGAALLLDCRSLAIERVPIPRAAAIVVIDTAAPRTLAASAYNDRRAACEEAVAGIRRLAPGVRSLRDVDAALLAEARDSLDPTAWRRAAHVVDENRRPPAMAAAFARGDLEEAGALMNASHESLRTLYEVSSPELDLAVAIARRQPGCLGARMTGAGFGGCAIALVRAPGASAAAGAIQRDYRAESAREGHAFVVTPAPGVQQLPCAGGAP
ncbi:MAG TPA: galactokinase [Vicinamibacterales bacterium]|nr:galactokinase [Vicinamibacterales bacterium]